MKLGMIFVYSLLVASPARAQYDDPAVAACEFSLKQEINPGISYKRTAATITAASVTLTYEISALGTRPKQQSRKCEFALAGGKFWFADRRPMRDSPCAREIAASIKDRTPTSRQRVRVCEAKARGEAANEHLRELRDRPLVDLGIYPIAPEDTGLRAR